jgi:hypothetical protein
MADQFFVRIRGKISGPYDVPSLQKLVRRGMLSRIHQISSDRQSWSAAGEFEDLFPAPATSAAVQVTESAAIEVDEPVAAPPSAPAVESGPYFYSQDGSIVGPVPLAVLISLTRNGTLQSNALVWRENAETGVLACHMPALAPNFGDNAATASEVAHARISRSNLKWRQQAAQRAEGLALAIGVGAGGAMLVFLNLPWFGIEGHPVWWWDIYRADGAGLWAALLTYLTFAAVALCVFAPIVRGIARGITYLSLAVFAATLFLAAVLSYSPEADSAIGVIANTALAALVGACLARAKVPDDGATRTVQGIVGGIALFGLIVGGIVWIAKNQGVGGVPDSMLFGLALMIVGLFTGFAAGVMGLVGLKPIFTKSLNMATGICSTASLIATGIGLFAAIAGAMNLFLASIPDSERQELARVAEVRAVVDQAIARGIITIGACLSVLAIGLFELLVAASAKRASDA